MFSIKLTAKAKRQLKDLSKLYRESIGFVLEDLKEDPFMGKPLTREFTGKLSYKIGTFRIIYQINLQNKSILIISAGHRSTVYN